jgi:hypothetical protein
MPSSASVGTSGSALERFAEVAARMRRRPDGSRCVTA